MKVGIRKKLEQFKRQLRRRRSWLLACLSAVALMALLIYTANKPDHLAMRNGDLLAAAAKAGNLSTGELVLHKIYICGDQYESLGYYKEEEVEEISGKHPDWKLEGIDGDDRIIYSTHVEDLSPDCRRNAYFGLDQNNSLTLFEGKPGVGKIIRTYFQINLDHLTSSLPHETVMELHEGIKITDLAEYNSVLSTFSDYALDEAEEVLRRTVDI